MYATTITFLLGCVLATQAALESQCPEVLTVTPSNTKPGSYDALLKLKPEYDLKGAWIRVVFDKAPVGVTTTFGEAVSRDDGYLIKNHEQVLKANTVTEIPFSVDFTGHSPAPSVVGVRMNGRTVCPVQPVVPITPCPGVFSYDHVKDETGKWYGVLNLETEYELTGIWLRIVLDNKADFIKSDFGDVISKGNQSYLLKNSDMQLKPGTPVRIPFFVQHSEEAKPGIVEVRLNGRTICEKK